MKNVSRDLLRKVVALLMCVCMLMGDVSVALSDAPTVDSPPVLLYTDGVSIDPADEALLSDYATLSRSLTADRDGTELPEYVEDGQSLFFQLAFELTKQEGIYKLRRDYLNGLVDENTVFTVDISFLNLLGSANYPTSYESDDNIASYDGMEIFRWWVDEATGTIRLRFYKDVYNFEGDVSNTKVSFEGTLDASGHDADGQLHFGVDGETVSLTAKQSYVLTKTAGVPYFSTDASSYLVDYTVDLTLGQNMKLAAGAAGNLYEAALTLEDTVLADGALEGELFGDPVITPPEGESASVVCTNSGTTNTLTLSSPDQVLNQGTYTLVYKMKVDSAAALKRLADLTEAQKTNTVEVKENGASLKTPLTATATIAWDQVTENQFKIDKDAFTNHTEEYGGAYLDEDRKKVYVDFRVTVYIREPFSTFTVDDWANYALTFRTPDDMPVTLEGVDTSADFWNTAPKDAELTYVDAIVTNTIDGRKNVITLTAPEGQMLPAGAYQLRVPADITSAVASALEKDYPQYYSNTAWLVKVDDYVPTEKKEWKSLVPTHDAPSKQGGYEVDPATGKLIFVDGKPLIRWDVWFGWNFYDKTTFVDTLENMELLVNDNYPFEIHSFDNKNKHKERLASFTELNDTSYIDFNEAGNGFTFKTENLDLNSDGSYVKLYKLVYFSTPTEDAEGNYLTSGLNNSYVVTHTDPFGNGFGHGPIPGTAEPSLTANGHLYVSKKHVIELNDTTTKWQVTVDNKNKVPFELLSSIAVLDAIPHPQEVGELDIIYSADRPISLNMTLPGINTPVPLTEGVHYTIVKELEGFNFGTDGNHGFAAVMNMEELGKILAENNVTYFSKIDMTVFLKNTAYPSGGANEKTLKNDGGVLFTNQGTQMLEYVNASYKRGFATKRKDAPAYGDYYDPTTYRNYTVCTVDGNRPVAFTGGYDDNPANGDGNDEILWKIFIGAREFENDPNPIKVTVTDTLSENQMFPTYAGKELKDLFLIEANKNKGYIIIPDSVELDGNTFTLTFTVPGGYWAGGKQWSSADVYIYYHTILKPEAIKEAMDAAPGAATVTINYDNTASVGWNDESYTLPTSTGSQAFSTTMLDKSSSIVTAVSEIEYSILINEHRVPLNNGQPLALTDTLGTGKEGFLYRDDSIRLFDMDTGKVLTAGSTVTENTYTITWATGDTKGFTISVPDARRLKLTYRVKPQGAVGENTDQLTNSASLDGKTDSHVQDSFKVSASNQEATYTPPEGTAAVSIRKLEGGSSVQTLLQGAEFTAYPVKADGTLDAAEKTATTGANGTALLEFTLNGDAGYDKVYCIKETKAPEGYTASNEEWYFYFSTTAHQYANAEVKSIVEQLIAAGKPVQQVMNQAVYRLNVENLPVLCDLHIRKVDAAGNDLEGAVFTLLDAKGNRQPAPTAALVDGVYTYTFKDLKGGNYTLTETKPPEGYRLGDVSSWSLTLDSVNSSVTINWAEGTPQTTRLYAMANGNTITLLNDPVEPAVLELPVVKTLDGIDTTETVFTFTLAAQEVGQPMPASATVSTEGAVYTAGSAEVTFGPIDYTYDMVGNVYTYTVTENQVDAATGFLASTDVYTVQVEVLWEEGAVVAQIKSILCGDAAAEQVVFTNTYVPYTKATVIKVWDDEENNDGLRPTTLTVTLSDGTEVELNEGNSWTATVENLPKYENGELIAYTWTEGELPEGYTLVSNETVGTVTTITNKHTPELTEATVIKVWDDEENNDGARPATLTVTLSDSTEVELNEGNSWTATVENLPKYEDGELIAYTWTEGELPEGYTLVSNETVGTVTTITNKHTPELTEATVIKVWDDEENNDGARPATLTVTLSDSTEVELNEGNSWTATVENLPKYEDGELIAYTWTEGELPEGYTLVSNETVGTVTTITNKHTPELTEATVIKVWDDEENNDGARPETLTVTLSDSTEVELNEGNSWTATVENLPKYEDGELIAYTWTEGELPEGYTLVSNETVGTVTTITNKHTPELTEATVIKVWDDEENNDGARPETLTVTLSDSTEVELNEGNSWTATVENLPKYEDGELIAYTWTEGELPEGYTLVSNETVGTVTTITNKHTPELTEATVIKVWDDEENNDGLRPEILTVTLSDSTEVELNEGNSWTATVENLPKYEDGELIAYTWTEGELPEGYTLVSNETVGTVTTITNKHTPELTEATVIKVWDDEENNDGARPETLTVTLSDSTEVELNEGNSWTATVENLPKYEDGELIAYTWTEGELPEGYTLVSNETVGTVTTITNKHTPELTEATVIKVWDDAENNDGARPTTLTVSLSNGTEVELNEGNNWTATVENLPKYDGGELIAYTWTEGELPEGYTLVSNETVGTVTTITNKHTPELTEATVIKVWDDEENNDGLRPETLIVTLSDSTEVELNEGNSWTATVENLPKYEDGELIAYTWTEGELPEGYTLVSNETVGTVTTITNKHTPELTEATVIKVWDDEENNDNARPETLTVTLSDSTEVELNEGNSWTATVENLPKYEDGELIAYTWTEGELPEGYTLVSNETVGTVTTITNKHTPELTEATVIKVWDDEENNDGARPETLTVTLSDSTEVELNEGNSWTATVENLPKYEDGELIAYTWTEGELPEGYTLVSNETVGTVTTITNKHTPETTAISVTKAWDDANDQDGLRPDIITVYLLANNEAEASAEITPDENGLWSHTFTDLPKYEGGVEIGYTVAEASVSGYSSAVSGSAANGYVITNTRTPDQTSVSGVKFWDDADDQDGLRPVSFVITLYGDSEVVDSVTVTAEDSWMWSFTGLPQRNQGVDIVYTIAESDMLDAEGNPVTVYTAEVDGFNVTNHYTPQTVSISGSKTWADDDNRDGKRPEQITIELLADGTVVDTATVTAEDEWKWSFTDLPKYEVGKVGHELTYTIREVLTEADAANYTATVNGYDVTNTHTPETVSVSGSKTWADDENRDGKRPEQITIELLADGTVVDTVTVTADDEWKWSFTDLPKYEVGKVGHELTYTIREVLTEADAANYTATVNGYDVTNTHTPETVSISGSKTWNDDENRDGKRPEQITIELLADGTVVDTATVTAEDEWKWSFTDLPKYEVGKVGHELTYTIREVLTEADAANYTATVNGYDVTNTHTPETVSISGSKTWADDENRDGKRPEQITIELLADGTVVDTATVTAEDEWKWSFTDLPKYESGKVGHELTYTIREVLTEADAANYTATVTGYDVTNTHTPETVSVSGSKTWADDENRDGKRPEQITIELLADGTVVDTVTVTADDEWKWSFTDLPKYEIGKVGHELTYTIREVLTEADAANYTATVNGYDVTNTHTPETVSVSGSKTWNDDDNRDGKRPEQITIELLADGTVVDTVTVTADDEWKWSFTDLPKYEIGKVGHELTYTIREALTEADAANYTATVSGYDVTNTHTPETVSVSGSKTWNDDENRDGKRPEQITIELLADGTVVDTATVTADDEWKWSFTDLPKYEVGKVGHELTYTIREVLTEADAANYTATVTGYDVTNTHTPETVSISGSKIWADDENRDGKRPEQITIELLADGTVVDTATVTADDEWKWSFTDLPKYEVGKVGHELTYTIREVLTEADAANYTATVNGYDVTNTHTPETVSVSGSKTWNDLNNAELTRPESITIRLYANGTEVASRQVTAEDEWKWSFTDLPKYEEGKVGQEIRYTIVEDAVPGYTAAVNGYDVTNTLYLTAFLKVDEQTGKPLTGAGFALYKGRLARPEGTPLKTWLSGAEPELLTGLIPGESYTVFETKTPAGFVTMPPFIFTVQETDTPDVLRTFTAANRHVYRFRKLDSATGNIVSGAELAVMQGDIVIDSWTSSGENDGWHAVADARFTAGETYTLVEIQAPSGYLLADPIQFTIDAETGLLVVDGTPTNGSEIVMYDQPEPQVTPTPEPTELNFHITKRWEDRENVLGLRPATIIVDLFRKTGADDAYPETPFMTVTIADNGTDEWKFTISDLPRRDGRGRLYTYLAVEQPVEGYTTTYLNNGRTIVNTIPEEDLPPTPTPTLPYATPTPGPSTKPPMGVQYIDGVWYYVDEYGIPLGVVPQTGDYADFTLMGLAIALPLIIAALAAMEIRRRKRLMAASAQDQSR
ncbi:MAG: Cna B-type domain-containing protein [Clostridiales bacterium]|nr:Cna B-type domain-containing protein [Clostridiales bacterium]